MRLLLLVAIVVALVIFLLIDLGERAIEPSAEVHAAQHWGRVTPPYIVDSAVLIAATQPRARTAPSKRTTMRAASAGASMVEGSVNGYPCGGSLPPCFVLARESGGDPTAQNRHSTASGLWQFLDTTWANFMGYPKARLAPVDVQNEKARLVWDHGRGCSHWFAC